MDPTLVRACQTPIRAMLARLVLNVDDCHIMALQRQVYFVEMAKCIGKVRK